VYKRKKRGDIQLEGMTTYVEKGERNNRMGRGVGEVSCGNHLEMGLIINKCLEGRGGGVK
jgi:hypothetical protein